MKHIARKRFGQHFLTDAGLIEAIVNAIDPRAGQSVVEIGPGLGALTRPVVQRCGRLTVIELDRDLAARLRSWSGLQVIESDVLSVDWRATQQQACAHASASSGALLRVVGNLPYNISTPILFHLLEAADVVQDQHFMLQSEVVDRMVAGPGSKAYGRLSVMLQWRYAMERVLDVPPEAFDPPPAVDSAVVRMLPLAQPPRQAPFQGEAGRLVAQAQRLDAVGQHRRECLQEGGFRQGSPLVTAFLGRTPHHLG